MKSQELISLLFILVGLMVAKRAPAKLCDANAARKFPKSVQNDKSATQIWRLPPPNYLPPRHGLRSARLTAEPRGSSPVTPHIHPDPPP